MSDLASGALPDTNPLHAPGLKRRKRLGADARYFLVPTQDIKRGYRPRSMTIPPQATELEAAVMCRRWWGELIDWREGREVVKPISYTFEWLIGHYLWDELSPFHSKAPATRDNYRYECAAIKTAIGRVRFDPIREGGQERPRIVGEDIRRWHHAWGNPKGGDPTPSRARHLIVMVRTLISYGVEMGAPGCIELRQRLAAMKFSIPVARLRAPTYDEAEAFASKALELGFRSQAIATLAQHLFMERRISIIGQWHKDVWIPGWEWKAVTPDWRIQYYQNKTGPQLREFDLKVTQRLLGLLQETPKEARTGAIIICERTGQPWRKRYYQEVWRDIARAAGLPDDVWSMDMRAGGITEADGIEVDGIELPDRLMRDGPGHADLSTTDNYRRNKQRNANKVVVLKLEARDRKS